MSSNQHRKSYYKYEKNSLAFYPYNENPYILKEWNRILIPCGKCPIRTCVSFSSGNSSTANLSVIYTSNDKYQYHIYFPVKFILIIQSNTVTGDLLPTSYQSLLFAFKLYVIAPYRKTTTINLLVILLRNFHCRDYSLCPHDCYVRFVHIDQVYLR